jgi:hypothetical protein
LISAGCWLISPPPKIPKFFSHIGSIINSE